MAGFDGFPRDALTFLWELRANNNVAFYEANKERCEKALRLPLGGVVTGVEDVPTATTNGTVYDLSGRTMPKATGAPLPKGLYIVNGKKVVVK